LGLGRSAERSTKSWYSPWLGGAKSFDGDLSHDDVIQEALPYYDFLNLTVTSLKQAGMFTCGAATA